MSFFTELKRRNVFRVALLYVVASWLILQVTDVGMSLLGLPDWTGRFVFFLLLLGFPLVMVFSWAYEITPEGLKKERDVPRDESITRETARKLNTAVAVLLVLAIGGLIADRLIPESGAPVETTASVTEASGAPVDQSIAVLPFVNMSSDEENEYFSDGLSEELLNLLAKIPELQVAARTSAFRFKNVEADITDIAAQLNLAHVLEGSVRKSGDQIRITAQLIKASDGYHLWSETWDRTLVDVFAIQDEIAASVVDALKVELLGEVPHAQVTDPRVFELFLRAKASHNRFSEEGLEEAIKLLTEALAIDPDYSEGWRQLSTTQINLVGQGYRPEESGYAAARASAERALAIDPLSAEAHTNLGWIAMYGDRDFKMAAEYIGRARQLQPGNASVLNTYGVMNGVFGRLESMRALYEEALVKDPLAMSVLGNLAGANLGVDLQRTDALIARMKEIDPESYSADVFTAWRALFAGDSEIALDLFSEFDDSVGLWGQSLALWDLGRDAESNDVIEEMIRTEAGDTRIALSYAHREDYDKAFEWLDRALESRDYELVEIRMWDPFKRIYGDPRWEAFLSRLGISDADAEQIF